MNRKQFKSAVKKGLGRAKVEILNKGLDDYVDLVLAACLSQQCYDTQSEPSRAKWLFELFQHSDYYPKFQTDILSALTNSHDERDLEQLFDLAYWMAKLGDKKAKKILRQQTFKIACEDTYSRNGLGAEELLKLGKKKDLLKLAKIYSQRLKLGEDDCHIPFDQFIYPKKQIARSLSVLKKHAQADPDIQTCLNYLQTHYANDIAGKNTIYQQNWEQQKQLFREKYPLAQIILRASNKEGKFPGLYARFGRCATPEELEYIFVLLLKTHKKSVRKRLLWVFSRTAIPRWDKRLLKWAASKHSGLKWAATTALGRIQDRRIYQFAKKQLVQHGLNGDYWSGLDLFLHNYGKAVPKLLMQALSQLEVDEEDEHHGLASSIIKLTENNPDPKLFKALEWVYENTPCSFCRCEALQQLKHLKKLRPHIKREAAFDSHKKIRQLVTC